MRKKITIKIGKKIAQARKNLALSQTDLSNLMGIHQVEISRYENDKALPMLDTFVRLCISLKVSADYFLFKLF